MNDVTNRPVLVGVDGSRSATQAVRWAAREAARRDVPLVLATVWTAVPVDLPHTLTLGPYQDALIEQSRQWLADADAAAQGAARGVTTITRLASGSAAGQLIEMSAAVDLMVLGSRGLGGFIGLVVGSVAVAAARHGHCPVVVVRGADSGDVSALKGPVVVGVDGSPNSQAAVRFAFDAAAGRGSDLVAVHASRDAPMDSDRVAAPAGRSVQDHEAEVLRRSLAECQARYHDVRVDRVVVQDKPARALLDRARDAQLVVVGSRGRGGFRGLLLGSTSQALIYHADCPVAVVPTTPV